MRHTSLIFLLVAAGMIGCTSEAAKQDSAGGTDKKQTNQVIAVSVLTLANPFFKEIADTMKAEGAKHGFEVVSYGAENDPAIQHKQVQDFIARKVDAIVLTPCNSRSVGATIREANEADIPVFTADIACLDKDVRVVSHIATDNYGGGREAAKAMIEALDGRGKVAIIDYPEVESVILRTRGFEDELAESKSDLEIVQKVPGSGDREKSFKAAQDLLQSHPDLAGIFAINDPSALGAVAALEQAGKLEQVTVVGFDGQPDGKRAIREGKIYADPIQFPDRIAIQTVETIAAYLSGEEVKPEVLIPTKLYRQSDAQQDPALE